MIRVKLYRKLADWIRRWRNFWATPYSGYMPEIYWVLLFKAKRLEDKKKG